MSDVVFEAGWRITGLQKEIVETKDFDSFVSAKTYLLNHLRAESDPGTKEVVWSLETCSDGLTGWWGQDENEDVHYWIERRR